MHVRVAPSNGSSSSNEENINVEDVPDAVTYVKPPNQSEDIKDMKKVINILLESQVKPEDKKKKVFKIGSKIFTMTVTIMTLAAAVIPFLFINSSDTATDDTTTETANAIGVTSIATATSTTTTSTTSTTTDPTTTITSTTTSTTITLTLTTSISTTTMTTNSTSANRFLVVGGYLASSSGPSTEVIDLANPSLTCNSFGELGTEQAYSVGGLLENTPIVCGGSHSSIRQSCLIFGQSQTMTMNEPRKYAVSVVLNTTTMWVMGGQDDSNYLSSTELITLEKAVSGPSLPHAVSSHCAVKFNESQIYVIGGRVNGQYTNDVYVFNPLDNFSYIHHSAMNYQRAFHGCAVKNDGESLVIVAAGGYGKLSSSFSYANLDSVEILDPSLGQWIIGPSLPYWIYRISQAMVTSPDGGGVMIIGGKTPSNSKSPKILELRASGSSWQEHDQELDNGRYRHVVIPVPESITTCQ